MKKTLKIFKFIGLTLGVVIIALFAYIQFSWDKTFDAPLPEIKASTDSTIIARGKHLVYGPAHCVSCHVPMDKVKEAETGKELLLSGGWEFPIPPGTLRAPNLTPDKETGIGNISDSDIAKSLRYSVNSRKGCVFPIMPFQNVSDEDLTAIISFLRSQPPVSNKVEPSELTFLGKALVAFGLIKPVGPVETPPKSVAIDSTEAYGKYLANSIANCNGCHTKRDFVTGAFIGEPFAGGTVFPPDAFSQGYAFITPNITFDQETGIMAKWDEDMFISRMRQGKVHKGSPMPWGLFGKMSDLELKAIYRYLKSIPSIENKVDKIVFAPGEALPE